MKKTIYIILAFILILGLSCGKKESSLTFMHFWTSEDVRPVINNLVAEFEAANPDIKIELIDLNWSGGHDKITISFSTNTAADIIELGSDWVPEYAAKDLLMDLSDESEPYQDSLMGWEAAFMNDKIYGFPWMLGTRVIFYNKNLMTDAGLNPKIPPRNWEELYDYSKKINELGEQIYGFGSNAYEKFTLYKKFLPFLWANNGKVLEGDSCMLESPEAVEALKFYTALSDIGFLESQRRLDDKFMAGELGFIISGDWLLRMMRGNPPDFQVGACVIPGPKKDGARSASFLGGEFLTVNARSNKKEEALEFIRFLVSKGPNLRFNQAAGFVTPSNKQAAAEILRQANPLAMTFLQQLNYARPSPVHPKWVQIQFVIEDAVQKAIYHKGTPEEILKTACDEIAKIINEE